MYVQYETAILRQKVQYCLLWCSLHINWNLSIPVLLIVLDFNPGVNWVGGFSVKFLIQTLELSLRFDSEQIEVVERVECYETPGSCPCGNANCSSNIDSKKIPRFGCVTLKIELFILSLMHIATHHFNMYLLLNVMLIAGINVLTLKMSCYAANAC